MQRVSRGRKSSSRKGWGYDHQRRRKAMLQGIANGTIPAICGRCGGGPRYKDPWEAGHIVSVALGGGPEVRPEHRSCNRRAGGKLNGVRKNPGFSLNTPPQTFSSQREKSAPPP